MDPVSKAFPEQELSESTGTLRSATLAAEREAEDVKEDEIMDHREDVPARVGDLAPDFTLPGVDGGQHSLSAFRGRWVILFTWGSW